MSEEQREQATEERKDIDKVETLPRPNDGETIEKGG
jgi:hypothetical protein